MTRRGAALLLALWLVTLLGTVTRVGLGFLRTGFDASRNRLGLVRATWAREGCAELLQARYADSAGPGQLLRAGRLDSVALGPSLWCRAEWEDPGTRVQLNLAPPEDLEALFGDSLVARAVLGARPLPAVEALWWRLRLDSARLAPVVSLVTVRGDGRINLLHAPAAVLRLLPGADPAVVTTLLEARDGAAWTTVDQMISSLPSALQTPLLAHYDRLSRVAAFQPSELTVRVEGAAGAVPLRSTAMLTVIPAEGRLAVVRREDQ
ncbi:MAG: hypothetical protein OEW80_11020 [Gemmatimonadota bacterium]|nr:hypothetical protein [Gemmatimonadota bacterium]